MLSLSTNLILTKKTELKIVENLLNHYECKDSGDFASNLVKWAEVVRKTFDDGGCDENITTRRLTHIVRAFSIFKKEAKAIELCLNRFDEVTKMAFLDLYSKISAGEDLLPEAAEVEEDRNPYTSESEGI